MRTSLRPGQTVTNHPSTGRKISWRSVRHCLEMVAAMLVGMMLLGRLWTLIWPGLPARADVDAMVMATNMAIGMAAWMRIRRHSWISIAEMSAAMYLPTGPRRRGQAIGTRRPTRDGHPVRIPASSAPSSPKATSAR